MGDTAQTQSTSCSQNKQSLLNGWSNDQIEYLCEELAALGYDKTAIADEYRQIQTESDLALKEAMTSRFQEKYISMALGSLRHLARRSKSLRGQRTRRSGTGLRNAIHNHFQII